MLPRRFFSSKLVQPRDRRQSNALIAAVLSAFAIGTYYYSINRMTIDEFANIDELGDKKE